jgi:hypothetical protein
MRQVAADLHYPERALPTTSSSEHRCCRPIATAISERARRVAQSHRRATELGTARAADPTTWALELDTAWAAESHLSPPLSPTGHRPVPRHRPPVNLDELDDVNEC